MLYRLEIVATEGAPNKSPVGRKKIEKLTSVPSVFLKVNKYIKYWIYMTVILSFLKKGNSSIDMLI